MLCPACARAWSERRWGVVRCSGSPLGGLAPWTKISLSHSQDGPLLCREGLHTEGGRLPELCAGINTSRTKQCKATPLQAHLTHTLCQGPPRRRRSHNSASVMWSGDFLQGFSSWRRLFPWENLLRNELWLWKSLSMCHCSVWLRTAGWRPVCGLWWIHGTKINYTNELHSDEEWNVSECFVYILLPEYKNGKKENQMMSLAAQCAGSLPSIIYFRFPVQWLTFVFGFFFYSV